MRNNVSWAASPLLDGVPLPPDRQLRGKDLAFFQSASPDPVETACRLARFYGCAPSAFLDLEPEALARTVEATLVLMQEEAADD